MSDNISPAKMSAQISKELREVFECVAQKTHETIESCQ
jgi:hypothetical protein